MSGFFLGYVMSFVLKEGKWFGEEDGEGWVVRVYTRNLVLGLIVIHSLRSIFDPCFY